MTKYLSNIPVTRCPICDSTRLYIDTYPELDNKNAYVDIDIRCDDCDMIVKCYFKFDHANFEIHESIAEDIDLDNRVGVIKL